MAFWVSGHKAIKLYKGEIKLASKGEAATATSNWEIKKLIFYLAMGIFAGVVGGMLGLGGGFIMGPLFIEMGVPPQVNNIAILKRISFYIDRITSSTTLLPPRPHQRLLVPT